MNEIPRSFTQVEKVSVSNEIDNMIIDKISTLKREANDHSDFDVTIEFMDAITDFKTKLLNVYSENELKQVSLFHHLTSSGMRAGEIFENPVDEATKLKIEFAIKEFVEDKLEPILKEKVVN